MYFCDNCMEIPLIYSKNHNKKGNTQKHYNTTNNNNWYAQNYFDCFFHFVTPLFNFITIIATILKYNNNNVKYSIFLENGYEKCYHSYIKE